MQRTIAILAGALTVLSGCLQHGHDPFETQQDNGRTENPRFPGLVVEATLGGTGSSIHLNATATNKGSETFKISSICAPPWSDQMRDDSGAVERTEPMAYCAAFGLKEFPPGATERFSATWNGTLWDGDERRYQAAPHGTYTWIVSFETFRGGSTTLEFDERGKTSVALDVTVS